MNHQAVSSSNIESVGYQDGSMQVKMRLGKNYEYKSVPPEIHAALMSSPSMGKYFHSNVRGKFEHSEVA